VLAACSSARRPPTARRRRLKTASGRFFARDRHKRLQNQSLSCRSRRGNDSLDYMHARYFSPHLGRFMSVDPAKSAHRNWPQSWNRFSYTQGNPLKYVDPDGETVESALELIGRNAAAIYRASFSVKGRVTPIEIARVLFQENRNDYNLVRYNDSSAAPIGGPEIKNGVAMARFALFGSHGSFGIAEMRTDTAARLFGWDPENLTAEQRQQIQETLSDPELSIKLIVAYLSELKRQRPNAPIEVILSDYNRGVSDSYVVNEVGGRSGPYLQLIQEALETGLSTGGEVEVVRCGDAYKFSNQCEE